MEQARQPCPSPKVVIRGPQIFAYQLEYRLIPNLSAHHIKGWWNYYQLAERQWNVKDLSGWIRRHGTPQDTNAWNFVPKLDLRRYSRRGRNCSWNKEDSLPGTRAGRFGTTARACGAFGSGCG